MRAIEEAQPLRLACAAIMVPSARRGLFGAAFSSAANSPYHRIASDREYRSTLHHRSRSAVSCERMRNERTGDCLWGPAAFFRITVGFFMHPVLPKKPDLGESRCSRITK